MFSSAVYQFLLGCFAAFGSFLFGYDLGVIAGVEAGSSFKDQFLQESSSVREGTIVALFTAGCFFGAFAAGFCHPLGRRGTIMAAACVFIAGGIIQTSAQVIAMLYAGRFIAGLGVGCLCMIVPIFQAEISNPKFRGAMTALQQLFNDLGQFVATWTTYGTFQRWNGTGDSAQWRIPFSIQIIPAIILASLIFVFPESPRWLIDQDKHEEGLQVLAKLHAYGDKNDPFVRAEYELILQQVMEERSTSSSYLELFKTRANWRRIILTTMIQASCQMTGVSAIQYFTPEIFATIGISTGRALLYQAINAIIQLAGTALEMAVVDRVGRRTLEIWGSWIMSVMFIIGAILIEKFPAASQSTPAHIGFVAVTWIYDFVFSMTSGPLSWSIPAELYPIGTRMKGVSIGAMTSFAFNTMIGQVTPIAISSIGWRYYILFIVCNIANGIFFWAFLPETKGFSLEEMTDLFENGDWFIPTSKWQPKHELDNAVSKITEVQHVEVLNNFGSDAKAV